MYSDVCKSQTDPGHAHDTKIASFYVANVNLGSRQRQISALRRGQRLEFGHGGGLVAAFSSCRVFLTVGNVCCHRGVLVRGVAVVA